MTTLKFSELFKYSSVFADHLNWFDRNGKFPDRTKVDYLIENCPKIKYFLKLIFVDLFEEDLENRRKMKLIVDIEKNSCEENNYTGEFLKNFTEAHLD